MFLIADTVNGIQYAHRINILDTDLQLLNQDIFYSCLKDLEDGETIVTIPTLSMAKKIHKEYGISR